ncbi:uncharacterized protein LOC113564148 [Drosophila erecta]|uniref:uncharacterized protein LOC113564148 n=1 Tax=Drosophila erecta TaxID=7220 RepID=UPI000F065046|nr:uncharacterized protein LOC113564148 [Drosophila erecta]
MSSIVNLNDNCLIKIVEHLDLEDQLHLFQATESISRLCKVISRCWQHQSRHSLFRRICGDSTEVFLQCISSTVVELTLDFSIDDLCFFRKYSFPMVRALDYSREESSADDIGALVNCFPLIESLKITETLEGACLNLSSGHHVAKWEYLRKLDIIAASRHWKTKCFQEIC